MARLEGVKGHAASAMIRLLREGFDKNAAKKLAERYPLERIQRQCELMKKRSPAKSRLGMLRKAIEEDWPDPEAIQQKRQTPRKAETPRSRFIPPPKERPVSPAERKQAARKLQQFERELRIRWPERLARFEEEDSRRRLEIEQMPMVSEKLIRALLSSFDSSEKKLERLRICFTETR